MQYYYHYVNWLLSQDIRKLKFLDESHILPKALRQKKAISMINQRVWVKASDLNQKHCSVTLLSSIVNDPPFIFDIREESNTSVDFVSFVISALGNREFYNFNSVINFYRFLNEGDIIIVDNASIHKDASNVPVLLNILQNYNITIVYLPTYSPELNPVELLFNKMKSEIKKTDTTLDINHRICMGLAQITQDDMVQFYIH